MSDTGKNGEYLTKDIFGHAFDQPLANAISRFLSEMDVESVNDLGCGPAWYAPNIEKENITYAGFDGNPHTSKLSNGKGIVLDLATYQDIPIADASISLEVGEHIPLRFSNIFLDNLTRCTRSLIIVSWAVPNQPGRGHVNCQDNEWVIDKMKIRKWNFLEESSLILRTASTLPWFSKTIMVFENAH